MAYIPPLNGGMRNASISSAGGGSAAGAALISSGTLNLVAGTNITLSQAGNNISILGPNAGGGINFSASNSSSNLASVVFANSNNVSFGLTTGSQITASINALSTQSNQAASGSNGSFTFQTLSFNNANGVSFGSNGSAITASVAPNGIQSISANGSNATSGGVSFSNANNVAFGMNGATITASAATNGIQGLAAGTTSMSGGNVTFSNSNNINFGLAGSVVTASYAGGGGGGVALTAPGSSFSSGTVNFSVTGGGALSIAGGANSINFAAPAASMISATGGLALSTTGSTINIGAPVVSSLVGNNITLSSAGNTITISAAAMFNGGISNLGNTAGNTGATNTNGLILAGGNNITLSQSVGAEGAYVTIAAGSIFNAGVSNLGNTLGATGATNTNGLILVGGSNVTLSQSIGAEGAYVTINAGASAAKWEYPNQVFAALSTAAPNSLSLQHVSIPNYITATAGKIAGSLTVGTTASATTGTVSLGLWMGIYGLTTGSKLTLLTSGSANNSFVFAQSNSTTVSSGNISGMRQLTVPINASIAPGEYWIAAGMSYTTNVAAVVPSFTVYGNSALPTAGVISPIGASTSLAASQRDVYMFQGVVAGSTSGANSFQGSIVNNSAAGNVVRAGFYHAFFSATY